jgi:hypothetical protein
MNWIWTSKKLIDTIWLFEFLRLCYDLENIKDIENVLTLLNNHIRQHQKIKLANKINHTKPKPLNLTYKIELIDKIHELVINKSNISSDNAFLELQNTINKRLL